MRMYLYWLLVLLCGTRGAFAQQLVADTPPLSPAEQQRKFHLPPGFEIQLVAQEPDVHKPMNMSFDVHGSLWVTHSLEYPFPATSDDKARDAISIFSSMAADGRAQQVRRFGEELNIPIGIAPLGDDEALAWSIPNIYRLVDSDGDGIADRKTTLFGPFGFVDTHGNQNAFTRWIDGWIYANHGFYNDSHIKRGGTGPEVLHMQSGNTYRFRPDGTEIEQFSWGQVNPFGLCFDPLGNLYSADCHSRAVSLLLREGYYRSFGKPDDGLGFAPEITTIDHGGTGIAGVVYSTLPDFPPEYRDVLFVGNVITNRVHCDRLKWHGSSPVVTEVENFLTCDDPWFRPVDLQQGPDGALYIADFYNCIIGHYEVPLTHPKRDRERGRIWRVVYRDQSTDPARRSEPMPDLATLSGESLFNLLRHPNLTVRVLATNYLVKRYPQQAAKLAYNLLSKDIRHLPDDSFSRDPAADQLCHAVWILQRTSGISESMARRLLTDGVPAKIQVHAVKALGETAAWLPWHYTLVQTMLDDEGPFVRRAAAEAIAKHPAIDNLVPLLAALNRADERDVQFVHQIRIALRDQLRSPAVGERLLTLEFSPTEKKQLLEFAATAPSGPAAILLFDEALHGNVSNDVLAKALPAAARHVDVIRVDAMIHNIRQRFPGNSSEQISLLRALAEGLSQRGVPLTSLLRSTLTKLIKASLGSDLSLVWYDIPLSGTGASPSPWIPQQRTFNDDHSVDMMISSLPAGGERLGGILRSPVFDIPPALSFWMCGHNGFPGTPDCRLNYVRLVLEHGTEVARAYPPRNDVAQRFQWDLAAFEGRRGHVEVVDGATDMDAYAWLAVSRFEPAVVSIPDHPVGDESSVYADLYRLVGELKLSSLLPEIVEAADSKNSNLTSRLAATESLIMLRPERAISPLADILADTGLPTSTREQAAEQLARIDRPEARSVLLGQLKVAPGSVAVLIAAGLAGNQEYADKLLDEIRAGRASAMLLREPTVVERLKSSGLADVDEQIGVLTAKLGAADSRIAELIARRRAEFLEGSYKPDVGRAVFANSICAKCHRIGDTGARLGPALDGIGNRGLDRLLEDTLDPSRNVDAAFRTVAIATAAGQILTGFGLREDGQTLVFHDSDGKEIRLPLTEVEQRSQSTLSPMPANVIEQLPEREYYALLAYLLSLK